MTAGAEPRRRPRLSPPARVAVAAFASAAVAGVMLGPGATVAGTGEPGGTIVKSTPSSPDGVDGAAGATGATPRPTSPAATGGEPVTGSNVPPAAVAATPTSQTYPFRPTSLRLPSGAVVPVDPAGVDRAGVLAVPSDPSRVGWWTGGAMSGEPFGSVVVAGHVDSSTAGLGVMVEMLDVDIGARVVLRNGRQEQQYRIVSRTEVPRARLTAEADPFRQDVEHRLVLITCGGDFDEASRSYTHNVVVVAAPLA